MVVRVDGVTGAAFAAEHLDCAVGDHLVGVHVGRGAGAGLEDVDDELVVVPAVGYLGRGLADGVGEVLVEQTEIGVDLGRRELDLADSANEGTWKAKIADGEVLDGPHGLCAVVGIRGDLELAHGVPLGSVLSILGHHFSLERLWVRFCGVNSWQEGGDHEVGDALGDRLLVVVESVVAPGDLGELDGAAKVVEASLKLERGHDGVVLADHEELSALVSLDARSFNGTERRRNEGKRLHGFQLREGAEHDGRAEGVSDDANLRAVHAGESLEEVQGVLDVVPLLLAVREIALAPCDASKVEAETRQAPLVRFDLDGGHDGVVHVAAQHGVRMADQDGGNSHTAITGGSDDAVEENFSRAVDTYGGIAHHRGISW